MQFWKRTKRRWRMTWVGLAIGTFSACLWTVPASYFAPEGRIHGLRHLQRHRLGPGHRRRRRRRDHALAGNQAGEGRQRDGPGGFEKVNTEESGQTPEAANTPERIPEQPEPETDLENIGMAIRALVSATETPTPGDGPVDDRREDGKAAP